MRIIRLLLLTLLILAIPAGSFAQFAVSVMIAPPPLPVYVQPMAPGGGYLWTPGYWAYGDEGYFWVPGTWVMAPAVGLLWTPGYWGWGGNAYAWNAGYWGPHVGFYGGVNYGYGYGGVGYQGGYWNHGSFNYNRSVNNVNLTNVHVYNKTVINNTTINHVSYNGGTGGINARPNATEQVAARDRHTSPTTMQTQHVHAASTLKYEEVYRTEYRDLEEARALIKQFLEKVYNRQRLHSALGYRPPLEFERSLRSLPAVGKRQA